MKAKVWHKDATIERSAWMRFVRSLSRKFDPTKHATVINALLNFGQGRIKRYEKRKGGL